MKYILAVLLMTGIVCAADLTAAISGNSQFAGPNCRIQNDASRYDVSAAIQNPSSVKPIRITYSYYNSSSGQFEDGGKICDINPGMRQTCDFTIYTITGGQNATDMIPFKIVGMVGEICGNGQYCAGAQEYDTTLDATVTHYPSIYEQNILDKLDTARSEYSNASAMYTGSCYNTSGLDMLQFAYSEMQKSNDSLSICDMHNALYLANDAIVNIRKAEGYAQPTSCGAAPPANNNSQVNKTPPPKNNNTQIPQNVTYNQTLNETVNNTNSTPAVENATGITSTLMKGCVPFYVLAMVLLIAVWSEKKFSA